MKTFKLLLILFLIFFSFNSQANHEETIDIDGFEIKSDRISLKIYNKTSKSISYSDYLWLIVFDDGSERKYRSDGVTCFKYSDCNWYIRLNKKGFNLVGPTHDD